MIFGWILAIAQVPDAIAEFITTYTSSKILIIAGMLFTYLAIGTFLDAIPIILIFTPIFLPLAEKLGIPVVAFMVTMVFASAMGLASPPCGSCLWVGEAIGLPCRMSVFTDEGKTKIGLIKPVQMLSALSQDAVLVQVAKEVEEKTIQMVDEAK